MVYLVPGKWCRRPIPLQGSKPDPNAATAHMPSPKPWNPRRRGDDPNDDSYSFLNRSRRNVPFHMVSAVRMSISADCIFPTKYLLSILIISVYVSIFRMCRTASVYIMRSESWTPKKGLPKIQAIPENFLIIKRSVKEPYKLWTEVLHPACTILSDQSQTFQIFGRANLYYFPLPFVLSQTSQGTAYS